MMNLWGPEAASGAQASVFSCDFEPLMRNFLASVLYHGAFGSPQGIEGRKDLSAQCSPLVGKLWLWVEVEEGKGSISSLSKPAS